MSAFVPARRLEALKHDPRVAYVSEDIVQGIDVQTTPTGIQRIFANANAEIGINAVDDYRVDMDVAIIDTSVDFQHTDLNVVGGVNCYNWWPFTVNCVTGSDDDHCHGTHVAGTIGALDNGIGVVGVAPGARIWAVKVLSSSGSGFSSQIVAGIDWVAAHASTIEVAKVISKSQINLTWTDNATNETGFYIERCKGSTCTNFVRIATVGPNVTSYSNTGLAANTAYRYRVQAYSNIVMATTLKR